MNGTLIPLMRMKRLFLKILYEYLLDNKPIHSIPIFFNELPKRLKAVIASDQMNEAYKIVVGDLLRDGYIRPLRKQGCYDLTSKGVKTVLKKEDEMLFPHFDIALVLSSRYSLFNKIYADYLEGDYESAIFKAFKLLEETVRKKARLPFSDKVESIMSDAFKPRGGRLRYLYAETEGEQEGLHFMMRGAIMFFKSPRSHRTVEFDDPNKAIEILSFSKYLLDLVDQCQFVEPAK
jgi:uncharacterized protein (TIGR02391 family)